MARQQTHTVVETDEFGSKENWGEDNDYYGQEVMKMAEEWEQRDHKGSKGLGKDIKAWRRRRTTPYDKPHPMEQRPVKLAPFPTDRERLRKPLRSDRHVVVQSFRDRVYVNIREFYRHDVTKKWLPGKKSINLTLEDWDALMEASSKIDEAVQELHSAIQEKTEW